MTRMIDADAFKKENEPLLHCDFPYLSETTLEELIDEAPTIDAIPVSYIKKQIENDYRVANEIRAKGVYDLANSIAQYGAHIELFLEDWYEEHGKTD